MLKHLLRAACAAFLLAACGQNQAPPVTTPAGDNIGAAVTPDGAISYDELITRMEASDSLAVKISGKVSEVCQTKGCWMTLVSDQPGKPDMRVEFKDYAFFMPKDIVGKRVVMDGFARRETTPVDLLRHLAEDAGKSADEIAAITEPKRELTYEASGVLILK